MKKVFNEKEYWEKRYKHKRNLDIEAEELKFSAPNQAIALRDTNEIDQVNDSILEIGCGLGHLCRLFKNYTGVDISEEAIDIAKHAFPDKEFIACDILDIPKPKVKYNVCFCFVTLMCVPHEKIEIVAKKIKEIADTFIFIENVNFAEDGSYNFVHDYEKLFNVVKKTPLQVELKANNRIVYNKEYLYVAKN